MTIKEQTFQLSEAELVVLSAFFLALPLPPLLVRDEETAQASTEEVLKGATQSLEEKGCIAPDSSDADGELVDPNLAEILRDIAYGSQMVHIYSQPHGSDGHQTAYYRNDDRIVRQELSEDGTHSLSRVELMGKEEIETFLGNAVESQQGAKVNISTPAWNNLLSSRIADIEADVLAEIDRVDDVVEDAEVLGRLKFAEDVIKATLILECTCVYDRLSGQSEKASFVLTNNSNWLVLPSQKDEDDELLIALSVPKANLLGAVEGLFEPLGLASERSIS